MCSVAESVVRNVTRSVNCFRDGVFHRILLLRQFVLEKWWFLSCGYEYSLTALIISSSVFMLTSQEIPPAEMCTNLHNMIRIRPNYILIGMLPAQISFLCVWKLGIFCHKGFRSSEKYYIEWIDILCLRALWWVDMKCFLYAFCQLFASDVKYIHPVVGSLDSILRW